MPEPESSQHQQREMRIDDGGHFPLEKLTGQSRRGRMAGAAGPAPKGTEIEGRIPPQATDVEQAVLGAMLIEREAIPQAVEVLRTESFYDLRHQKIFEAILSLFERGHPVDLITLTDELRRRRDLDVVGGPYYLSELTTAVASAANVEHHARLLAEKSILRRLITTMTGLIKNAYDPSSDAFDLLDLAESEMFKISEANLRRGALSMSAVLKETLEHLEAIHGREGGITGVPTGFTRLDDMTGGWQPSDLIIIAARPSMGKCLGKGTPVMMYDGTIKPVEKVQVGDLLMGDDSTPRRVLSLARGREPMYWVRQTFGMDYRVNESHILSLKKSRSGNREARGTVTDICVRDYLQKPPKWQNDHKGYKVAVDFPEQLLPVDPYFLGLWLGEVNDDRRPTTDDQIQEEHQSVAVVRRPSSVVINKHIPHGYLANSKENRLKLLAGLLDSDGHRNTGYGGTYEITQKDKRLAEQIKFLCDTLGYRTSLKAKRAQIRDRGFESIVWRVRFNGNVDEIPVRVARKQAPPWADFRDWRVSGLRLEPDGVDDYYGFEIDGNRRFLLGDGTVTHNTAFSLSMMRNAALHPEKPTGVAIFSLEMSAGQLAQRLLTAEARVDAQAARTGRLHDDDWPRLAMAAARLSDAPIFIDDTPGLSILELRAKCRRLKAEHDIGLVVVDYLQLMHGTNDAGSREQEIAQISRSLKSLAKELNVPVIALSQLSRAVETRGGDKRPQLSDLRESGSIEQDADVVCFIYRAERYGITVDENGQSTEGTAEIIIGKQRNGPIGSVALAFVNQFARFENLTTYYHQDFGGGGHGGFDGNPTGDGSRFDLPPPGDAPF